MNKLVVYGIGFVLLAIVLSLALGFWGGGPSKYDDLAKCISASGAKFYGAYWCPHCANQKALFGSAAKHLPYVECSLPNAAGVTQACKDAGVDSYPTWVFAGGRRQGGELSLEQLGQNTGCSLPQ